MSGMNTLYNDIDEANVFKHLAMQHGQIYRYYVYSYVAATYVVFVVL